MASYVPLETQTPVSRESWCEVRERLSKTNLRHRFSRLVSRLQLHPSKRFSPADLPQVLIVCLFFFLKKGGPTNIQRKKWPLTFQRQCRSEGMAVSCSPPGRCGVVNTSDTAHPERFILLSNILSPRGRGKGKNLNWTRHFVGVRPSLKERPLQ